MKTKDLAISALFVAFIAVCAQISIPTPLVPFTLQIFAVTVVALTLSFKQVFYVIMTYIIMGLLGFPIFAGARGGIQMLLSPTLGFILGFMPYALILNTLSQKMKNRLLPFAILPGYLVFYTLALTVLTLNFYYITQIDITLSKLLTSYWLMFIPTDLLSIAIACILSNQLRKHFNF